MLQSMGFTRLQCIKALRSTDNNVERAADWIFSHPDEINSIDDAPDAVVSAPPVNVETTITDGAPSTVFISICIWILNTKKSFYT